MRVTDYDSNIIGDGLRRVSRCEVRVYDAMRIFNYFLMLMPLSDLTWSDRVHTRQSRTTFDSVRYRNVCSKYYHCFEIRTYSDVTETLISTKHTC